MGFRTGYTLGAVSSSSAKADKKGAFSVMASLIGNSISVPVLQWVLAQLAVQLGFLCRMPTRRELREGKAHLLVTTEDPGVGHSGTTSGRGYSPEEALVVYLTSRAGSKGSDVRITTGELLAPSKVRFQTVRPEWWNWRVAVSAPWREAQHINVLETHGALLDLIRCTRKITALGTRYVVLLDSYVALGVLSKRRSSSHKIQRVLRRFDALELASGVRPFFAYIRSFLNPADRPSRRPPVRRPAGESPTRKICRRR